MLDSNIWTSLCSSEERPGARSRERELEKATSSERNRAMSQRNGDGYTV